MKRVPQFFVRPTRRQRRAFTLVEMLVVIGIMVLLMGIAMPVLERMALGSGVDAGSRMLTGQLRLARQEAVSKRQNVALLMPADNVVISAAGDLRYTAMRLCYVDLPTSGTTWRFKGWVPGSKWEMMPVGSIVASVGQSSETTISAGATQLATGAVDVSFSPADFTDATQQQIATDAAACFSGNCRAIVFKRSGAMAYGGGSTSLQSYVTVAEGTVQGVRKTAGQTVCTNFICIKLNTYTGKVVQLYIPKAS